MFSERNRTVLFSEDRIGEGFFHVYRFELPPQFLETAGRRSLRIALAFDPPVRGTRLAYLSRTMSFVLYRGEETTRVVRAVERSGGDTENIDLPKRCTKLSSTWMKWSTLQCDEISSSRAVTFQNDEDGDSKKIWHLVVGCKNQFKAVDEDTQRYAVAMILQHNDARVDIYNSLRAQVATRARVRP